MHLVKFQQETGRTHIFKRIWYPVLKIKCDKTLDFVNLEILLHKLATFGVKGPAHSIIKNILQGRAQFVCVNNEKKVRSNPSQLLYHRVHFSARFYLIFT